MLLYICLLTFVVSPSQLCADTPSQKIPTWHETLLQAHSPPLLNGKSSTSFSAMEEKNP